MTVTTVFDVVIVGGGIAGATLAGVLARSGLGVLVVEKEGRFRDRVRGEGTWPWGVAEVRRMRLETLFEQAGGIPLRAKQRYDDGQPADLHGFDPPGIGFSHPCLQEAAFSWAAAQGATTIRPAKVTAFTHHMRPSVTVAHEDREVEYAARLVVGADGKLSAARRWAGGETAADPEHHRMGGVQVSGIVMDREYDNFAWSPGIAVNWFAQGADTARLYLIGTAERLRASGADRSFARLLSFAAPFMPEGALDNAHKAGPIGYHANNNVWATRLAGNGVVLIGDAAGAPDPTQGHGTALLFHDVRILSDILLAERDWRAATEEYANRRQQAYEVIREHDRWSTRLWFEEGAEADRRREAHLQAAAADPTLGGFALLEERGPDGLTTDEATRRLFFGEF